jgi:hypothetical protein
LSIINFRTVSNPDEFIFPHAVIVFSQPMGAKHPLPKEAEPVEYFSQLSAESLFDMVLMDVLHACQFLDIIHLCLKHDF